MKEFFKKRKKGIVTSLGVGILLGIFSLVAFHNLGKFETSDEDLWKDTRIREYWSGVKNGIKRGDWEKTRVNDKPGVSLAVIAGTALPFTVDTNKQDISKRTNGIFLYQKYRVHNTEGLNEGLRIPVVIFTIVLLAFSGFLLYRWTSSPAVTLFSLTAIALSPVLLGMSQILNPDAILWSSSFIALLCYLLLLKTGHRCWVVLAGLFFGWAILSKYTGNLLILFFFALMLFSVFFDRETGREYVRRMRRKLVDIFFITGIGYTLFAVLVPWVIVRPNLFAYGTFASPGFGEVSALLGVMFLVLAGDAFFWRARGTVFVAQYFRKGKKLLLRLLAGALLAVFLGHILNAWTGANFVPLNDLREMTEVLGSKSVATFGLTFPMISAEDGAIVGGMKKILVQSSYIFFTLSSFVVGVLLCGMTMVLIRGKVHYLGYVLFALGVPWVFIAGGLMADVLVNVRYGILLQPVFGLLAGIFLWEMVLLFREKWRALVGTIFGVAFFGSQMLSLQSIAPHFLNYQNVFLPMEMSFADSWSYGEYEAAMWLNAQPDAKYMEVWSDRKALCRFFVGKCIRGSSIDRSIISPEYFVVTRRNVVKQSYFRWKDPDLAARPAEYYYSEEVLNNPAWEMHIGGRPLNYVKIIRSEDALQFVAPAKEEETVLPIEGGESTVDTEGADFEEYN